MKKTDDDKRIQSEFRRFMEAPPRTEEEDEEHDISFEVSCLETALDEEYQKNKELPRTDEKIKLMKKCSRNLKVIKDWQKSKSTLDPVFYDDIWDIPGIEEALSDDSILRNKLLPERKPLQKTKEQENPSLSTENAPIVTNAKLEQTTGWSINTIKKHAGIAGIPITKNEKGQNQMLPADIFRLKASHKKSSRE